MLSRLFYLALVFLVSCAHGGGVSAYKNLSYTAAQVIASGDGGSMSATAFMYRGYMVTAGHFCQNWTDAQDTGAVGPMVLRSAVGNGFQLSGSYIPAIFRFDEEVDACVLQEIFEGDYTLQALSPAYEVRLGEPISVVGAPLGFMVVRTDGYVADPNVEGEKILVAASGYFGNSGSPVMNEDGVIGMLVAVMEEYPIIGIVQKIQSIDRLIDEL